MDTRLSQQACVASLTEVAISPTLRWDLGRLADTEQTAQRLAPLGVSYTSVVSRLERGRQDQGDRFLHHRCAVYDLLNKYGANG